MLQMKGDRIREKNCSDTHGEHEEKASLKPLAINVRVRACVCVCKDCRAAEKSEPRRKIDKIISNSGTLAHLKLNTRNRLHAHTSGWVQRHVYNSYPRFLIKLLVPTTSATVTTLTERREAHKLMNFTAEKKP